MNTMSPARPRRATARRALTRRHLLGAAAAVCGAPALAAVGGLPNAAHGDSSPEWEKLREKLFGNRPIQAAPSQVQLLVPLRAAYGASVPVKIVSRLPQTPALHVRRMHLLVDKNPSPLAAVLPHEALMEQPQVPLVQVAAQLPEAVCRNRPRPKVTSP